MADKKQKDQINDTKKDLNKKKKPYRPAEFRLVLWMLVSLTFLLVLLIVLPFVVRNKSNSSDFIEYTKWVLPALLGAFGAWIGAGAAYFFGKENLELSNKSTKEALEIQRETSKTKADKATIEDMNPTPLNPDFKFTMDSKVDEVINELNRNVDYWFVPVLENEKVKDVIHTEALWRLFKDKTKDPEKKTLSEVIDCIEKDPDAKIKASKLHGFFQEFKMYDKVSDVHKLMRKSDVSVGIICDDQGKATHCFSRKDLRIFMLGSS